MAGLDLQRVARYYCLRLKRLRGTPGALAGGTAIGVFIGLTPTIPFHTILIIGLAVLTRTSALAGIIVSWIVCNPLTGLPIYFTCLKLGNLFTPYHLSVAKIRDLFFGLQHAESITASIGILAGVGYETVIVMLVGGICLGIPGALISYYPALLFFRKIRQTRIDKKRLD